jgi:hypothetical protein
MSAIENVIEYARRMGKDFPAAGREAIKAEAELAAYKAIAAITIPALQKIASGEWCDNDGRGCNNESFAAEALAALQAADSEPGDVETDAP